MRYCGAIPTPAHLLLQAVRSYISRKLHLYECRIGAKHTPVKEFLHIAHYQQRDLSVITALELSLRPEAPLPDMARQDSQANRLTDENASIDTYSVAAMEGGDMSSNLKAAGRPTAIG